MFGVVKMLEYLQIAYPPTLDRELRRYYDVSDMTILRATVSHRYTYTANQGVFAVVFGRRLIYIKFTGPIEHLLPFEPVAIGVDCNSHAFLLGQEGDLWLYYPSTRELTLIALHILTVAPDATAVITKENTAVVGIETVTPSYITTDIPLIGTRSSGSHTAFCDINDQWYLGTEMIPFARAEGHIIHPASRIHYLRHDSLCWLSDNPVQVHKLMKGVRRIIGANGSVVTENHNGDLHFFMVSVKFPYGYTAEGEMIST